MLDYVSHIRQDGLRFADVIRGGPLDADVPTCPGWTLRELAHHLGYIHRWARLAAAHAREPDASMIQAPPSDSDSSGNPSSGNPSSGNPSSGNWAEVEPALLAAWLVEGVDALADTLAGVPVDAATWHPFPVPQVAAVWPRRQAHELAVHLWDAQATVGPTTTAIDPACAADFVREYFEVVVPRVIARDGRPSPIGRVRMLLTDGETTLDVRSTATTVDVEDVDGSDLDAVVPDGTIRGRSEDVLLALWHRRPLPGAPASGTAAAWLAFGGN